MRRPRTLWAPSGSVVKRNYRAQTKDITSICFALTDALRQSQYNLSENSCQAVSKSIIFVKNLSHREGWGPPQDQGFSVSFFLVNHSLHESVASALNASCCLVYPTGKGLVLTHLGRDNDRTACFWNLRQSKPLSLFNKPLLEMNKIRNVFWKGRSTDCVLNKR